MPIHKPRVKAEEATGFITLELMGAFWVQKYILESSAYR